MINRLFILITLLCSFSIFAENEIKPSELRRKFYSSVDNASKAREFIKELESSKQNKHPLVLGYKAAVGMLMAKHSYNPYMKFKYFIDGKDDLEFSISKSPTNIELRLIRFAIQTNAPSFLGYSKHITLDKEFLLKSLSNLDSELASDLDLQKIIKEYLKKSGKCTSAELNTFSNPV